MKEGTVVVEMKVKNTVVCPLCKKDVEVPEGKTRTQALTKHLAETCSARYGG